MKQRQNAKPFLFIRRLSFFGRMKKMLLSQNSQVIIFTSLKPKAFKILDDDCLHFGQQ